MLAIILFYLCLSAVAVWFAALSREYDRRHAVQIALLLLLTCGISNATWISNNWWTWPVMDASVAWFVAIRYRLRPTSWKFGLMSIAVGQQISHAIWHLSDKSPIISWGYTATLNVLFVAQLYFVASPGSERGRDRIRSVMAHWRNRRRGGRIPLLHRRAPRK